ncbi:MAG: hypothetical protein FJ202_02810 [Gemmatimonadetes bacterium]|nr:hypothetical protein [Gemmatimonadota bacterium]
MKMHRQVPGTSRSLRRGLLAAAGLLVAVGQVEAQGRRGDGPRRVQTEPARFYAGGGLEFGAPSGEFKDYVQSAFGGGGHILYALDDEQIFAFRADVDLFVYGHATRRQALGGGALGLIGVDVTTSNNIVTGTFGLQAIAPTGALRPYLHGGVGFSYFFTQSSVEGSSNSEPFATTKNFGDGGFTTVLGGGLYIPVRRGYQPISIDLGVRTHRNSDVQYLTKEGIKVTSTSAPPTLSPVRSAANYLSFRVGVSVGVR